MSLGGSKLLPFKNDFITLPQIWASTQSCLGALRTIPWTSRFVFMLRHALSTVEPYIDRYAFSNHVQSI
jgi:hypothetical protein